MKRPLASCLIATLLLSTTHRLPAPIVEEEKPTAAPTESAQPKSKPERSKGTEASSDSNAARRLDGKWQTTNIGNAGGISWRSVETIVITNGKQAQWTRESTFTLAPGKSWPGSFLLPPPYDKVSPISQKWTDESADLKMEGPNLIVHWPANQRLVDWAPKTIPAEVLEKSKGSDNTVTYIPDGARLISTTGKRSTIWQRVQ
ncbi:MAG TPA: hypothetical protein VNW72_04205 [Chthoniobacterales bacterium]|jgi:hypothetical protein|nr:hypothetical protein [Chthoniobacterales bacterium]